MSNEDTDDMPKYADDLLVRIAGDVREGWIEETGVIVSYDGNGYYTIEVNSRGPDDHDGLREGVHEEDITPSTT